MAPAVGGLKSAASEHSVLKVDVVEGGQVKGSEWL